MTSTPQAEMKKQGKGSPLATPFIFIFDVMPESGQSIHVIQAKP